MATRKGINKTRRPEDSLGNNNAKNETRRKDGPRPGQGSLADSDRQAEIQKSSAGEAIPRGQKNPLEEIPNEII